MRTCKTCGIEKAPADYYSAGARCKECVKARVRQHRRENIESVRAYDRERGLLPHRKAAVRARSHRYDSSERARRVRAKHPDAYAAHIAVGNALKRGDLKACPCERCGYAVGVHAHHEDYSKPLDVIWLCRSCHGARHREINAERRTG